VLAQSWAFDEAWETLLVIGWLKLDGYPFAVFKMESLIIKFLSLIEPV